MLPLRFGGSGGPPLRSRSKTVETFSTHCFSEQRSGFRCELQVKISVSKTKCLQRVQHWRSRFICQFQFPLYYYYYIFFISKFFFFILKTRKAWSPGCTWEDSLRQLTVQLTLQLHVGRYCYAKEKSESSPRDAANV